MGQRWDLHRCYGTLEDSVSQPWLLEDGGPQCPEFPSASTNAMIINRPILNEVFLSFSRDAVQVDKEVPSRQENQGGKKSLFG